MESPIDPRNHMDFNTTEQTDINHVEYILTADFDIDAGPTMTYQYPEQVPGDNNLMAELMLPDQSHLRQQDWTIFFLYKKSGQSNLEYHISDEKEKQNAQKYYVLNLVNTKFADTHKRGASVKAMSLITPHPFFHVFKPLLILALDGYFKSPSITHLQSLYDSINSIDMTMMPKLSPSERLVLASSENTFLFAEKFEEAENNKNRDSISNNNNNHNNNTNANRTSTSNNNDENNDSSNNNNNNTSGQPSYYIDLKNQGLVSRIQRDTHFYDTKVLFNGMKIPIKIPMDFFAESVGDFSLIKLISTLTAITQPFTVLHPELTIYGPSTPPLIVLINALLTQKRILFIGMNSPSYDVAEHVLAACSLGSGGILRSFTTHAFPYTDLSKVDDLLTSDGYIAGVKNPAFERHPAWWDVIVDTEAQTMKISTDIGTQLTKSSPSVGSSTINQEDIQFVDQLKHMISNHYGETSIRTHCRNYIKRFVRMATNYEDHRYGSTNLWPHFDSKEYHVVPGYGYTWSNDTQMTNDFNTYSPVFEGWRSSRSYQYYVHDQKFSWVKPPKYVVDFEYHLDRLRLQKLSYEESGFIYNTLYSHAEDYDDINKLLSASSLGNLFYLALGLFHRDSSIRAMTVILLKRIEHHAAGQEFFKTMNQFQKLAYKRLQVELQEEKLYISNSGPDITV